MLKEVDAGKSVKEICQTYGISDATFCKWKSNYGGIKALDLAGERVGSGERAAYKRLFNIVDHFNLEVVHIGVDASKINASSIAFIIHFRCDENHSPNICSFAQ